MGEGEEEGGTGGEIRSRHDASCPKGLFRRVRRVGHGPEVVAVVGISKGGHPEGRLHVTDPTGRGDRSFHRGRLSPLEFLFGVRDRNLFSRRGFDDLFSLPPKEGRSVPLLKGGETVQDRGDSFDQEEPFPGTVGQDLLPRWPFAEKKEAPPVPEEKLLLKRVSCEPARLGRARKGEGEDIPGSPVMNREVEPFFFGVVADRSVAVEGAGQGSENPASRGEEEESET